MPGILKNVRFREGEKNGVASLREGVINDFKKSWFCALT